MVKELSIGLGTAALVFMALQGIDVTPFVLVIGIFLMFRFMMEQRPGMGGKKFQVVGSGGETLTTGVTFEDVGGQEVAKREFMEALDFVKRADEVARLGVRPLKGILLTGPPGTGKTLMAKAAASYTDAVFMAASGSQFVEMYAGVGAQRVRKLFQNVREQAQKRDKKYAIIFVDEIEVLGGKRGQHSSHLEYDQTLNELLVQMDGLRPNDDVRLLVVAATNRPDLLDSALLRPGRFDRTVQVDLPDKEGRLHILKIHLAGKPLAADIDVESIARDTYGFSGAHLESLVNEAAIQALREDANLISMAHFKEATDKVMMGERLDRKPRAEERRRVAYHEVGHALVTETVRSGSVSTITITSRGKALGYMRQTPQDDPYLYTKGELEDQIAIALGGAVVEESIFGSRSTGSAGDFDQAVDLAEKMIHAGLSQLGVVSRKSLPPAKMHEEMQKIVNHQEERVRAIIEGHRDVLETVAAHLLEHEKISGKRLREMLAENKVPA